MLVSDLQSNPFHRVAGERERERERERRGGVAKQKSKMEFRSAGDGLRDR